MPSLAPAFILLGRPFDRPGLVGLAIGSLLALLALGAVLLGGLDPSDPQLTGSWRWIPGSGLCLT